MHHTHARLLPAAQSRPTWLRETTIAAPLSTTLPATRHMTYRRDERAARSHCGADEVYMLRNQIAELVVARSLQRQEEELLRLQVAASPRIPPPTIPSFVLSI